MGGLAGRDDSPFHLIVQVFRKPREMDRGRALSQGLDQIVDVLREGRDRVCGDLHGASRDRQRCRNGGSRRRRLPRAEGRPRQQTCKRHDQYRMHRRVY